MAARPAELLNVQLEAARQWGDFWTDALSGKPTEKPRDRRFSAAEWQDDAYYRAIRDAYLLASKQLRNTVEKAAGDSSKGAMARFLLDQYLNAIAPTNFAATNPEVVKRTKETGGQNLVQGFAQPDGGRRQRQGHRPAPHRSRRVQEGRDDRRDARRGRLRECAVPADPVHRRRPTRSRPSLCSTCRRW